MIITEKIHKPIVCYNIFPMIWAALFAILIFTAPASAFAENKATVNINTNIESSSKSTVNSKTDIRVETNGNVTSYTSDKAEDVEIKSVNGESEIKVKGVAVYVSPTATIEPTGLQNPESAIDEKKVNNKNIFNVFEDLLKKVFSFFD